MLDAFSLPGGNEIVTNQVLYNLKHRGIEWDLMPWCRDHNLPIMAYSPIEHAPHEQRGMLDQPAIVDIAARLGVTPAQIALAWLLQQDRVVAIPKASRPEHVQENRVAGDIKLSDEDLEQLDAAFPRPESKVSLEVK
jgi:diketogulonate reductase-like aldo/keto reductase